MQDVGKLQVSREENWHLDYLMTLFQLQGYLVLQSLLHLLTQFTKNLNR